MGLDWLVGNRPRPGFEAEFSQLLEAGQEGVTDEMRERFDEISIAAYTQVGAPVVGTDRIADAWLLHQVRVQDEDEGEDGDEGEDEDEGVIELDLDDEKVYLAQNDAEREALEEMRGYHVLELAPPCDGMPLYTHGSISDDVDLTSFRGKFLHDCEELLGEELMEKAYEDQSAEELVAFGNQLLEIARRHAREHDCAAIEEERELPDVPPDSPAARAHILFAAGRWCVYWGSRGHYLDTWF